jgi:Protein of unknown function (DUF3592)
MWNEIHPSSSTIGEVGLVLFVLGLFGTVTAWLDCRKGIRSSSWPAVPGKIIHSHTKKVKVGGSSVGQSNAPKLTTYRPQIIYSYEVSGVRLAGRRIQFASEPHTRMRSKVEDSVSEYPAGSTVTVYYDPAKPAESVLKPGVNAFWNRRKIFSIALVAIGIALWLVSHSQN